MPPIQTVKIIKNISFVPNGADGKTKDILSTSLNPRFLPFEFNLAQIENQWGEKGIK